MNNDLTLLLPDRQELRSLTVSAETGQYNELMQRVICLLILADHREFTINGMTIAETLASGNASTISALNSKLSTISDELKKKINEDGKTVDKISLSAYADNSNVVININITPIDGDDVSEDLLI